MTVTGAIQHRGNIVMSTDVVCQHQMSHVDIKRTIITSIKV